MHYIWHKLPDPSFEEIAAREKEWLRLIGKGMYTCHWFPIAEGIEFSSALMIDGEGLRIAMNAANQSIAAGLLNAKLPSKEEADLMFKQARHIEPCVVRPVSAAFDAITLHSEYYGRIDDLVDNEGKLFLRGADPGRSRPYGLVDGMKSGAKLRGNGLYMRQDSTTTAGAHNDQHVDATQTVRFVRYIKREGFVEKPMLEHASPTSFGDDDEGNPTGPVHSWQRHLESKGYDVGPIDGIHGKRTEAATQEWWGVPSTKPGVKKPIPFRQAKHYHQGRRRNIIGVCIHTAEIDLKDGAAIALMNYAATMPDKRIASWHYSVDHETETQSVLEEDTAWAAPGANETHIQIELCTWAASGVGTWANADHEAMLDRAAKLVADICKRHSIPIEHRTVLEVREHKPGICGHNDVTKAFKRSTHTDPGKNFPWGHFIRKVRTYAAEQG